MTRDECKRQAMRTARVPAWLVQEANAAAEKWFASYDQHDSAVNSGEATRDEFDGETFEHRTVKVQFHPPRKVAPFSFGPAEVMALARELRRELKL